MALARKNAPVSGSVWVVILACGTVAVISALHPIVTLILDFGGRIDG